jgi:hypothetical protein
VNRGVREPRFIYIYITHRLAYYKDEVYTVLVQIRTLISGIKLVYVFKTDVYKVTGRKKTA